MDLLAFVLIPIVHVYQDNLFFYSILIKYLLVAFFLWRTCPNMVYPHRIRSTIEYYKLRYFYACKVSVIGHIVQLLVGLFTSAAFFTLYLAFYVLVYMCISCILSLAARGCVCVSAAYIHFQDCEKPICLRPLLQWFRHVLFKLRVLDLFFWLLVKNSTCDSLLRFCSQQLLSMA